MVTATKRSPQSTGHLNGAQPCGSMKIAKSCNHCKSGSECHRFKTRCQKGLLAVESPLKCTLPLLICICNINSCVRFIGWLYIFFTCERCNTSSTNKRSTRVVATFKNVNKITEQSVFTTDSCETTRLRRSKNVTTIILASKAAPSFLIFKLLLGTSKAFLAKIES